MKKEFMRFLLLLLTLFPLTLKAQQADSKETIIAKFNNIRNTIPREKLYIHFDKSTYVLTDTIWFKGYLMDASLNNYSSYSGLVYTELINAEGEIVEQMSLPTAMGLTWGGFAIDPNKYQSGTYTFRAYTNWMQNFGSSYLFKKELKILGPSTNPLIKANPSTNRATAKKADTSLNKKILDIDVQFLPEGGKWFPNILQRMAFKSLNAQGKGIVVEGEIIDSKQNTVIKFKSNVKGMGYFYLQPKADETYTARLRYGNITKNINLPKVQQIGTTLQVDNDFNSDSVKITAYSTSILEQEMTLLGQSRGVLCFIAKIRFNKQRKILNVAKSIFPTGVCQILLLDHQQKVINERNFFINHKDELKLSIKTADTIYGVRDSIPLKINALNSQKNPVEGSFSIAITDDNQVAKDSVNDANILSYFLLSSDLKGNIENPGYYFHQQNVQKYEELDALMLTQGWVNYDWSLDKKPLFKMEKDYRINGLITNLLNKPSAKAKVTLLGSNKGFLILDTTANDKGEFTFDQLPLMDSASFVIQALNANGKKGTLGITIDEFKAPPTAIALKTNHPVEITADSTAENLLITKKQLAQLAAKDGILLNEVKIVGKRTIRGSKNLNEPGESDQTLTEEELNKISKKTLLNVLQEKVKGFKEGYRPKSPTREYFINNNPIKFIIDGLQLDLFYSASGSMSPNDYYYYIKDYLDYYSAEDIRGIEVMANFSKTMRYKSKFIHPMDETQYSFLEITTRTGVGPFLKKPANLYLYRPIKYGDTKVFYSPKYTTANKNDQNPDFRSTIYWNPNLITDINGNAEISFFSADKKGSYTVWLEGSDLEGNFGMKAIHLNIK